MKKLLLAFGLYLVTAIPASAGFVCSLPFTLLNGTTADATQVMANFNALATCFLSNTAKSGANSDITSLSALATPLSVSQGGTGATALTSGNLLVGNGGGSVTTATVGSGLSLSGGILTTTSSGGGTRVVTAAGAVAIGDCGGKVQLGGTAFYSMSLPSAATVVAGGQPTCTVKLYNADNNLGKQLSGGSWPSTCITPILYPHQSLTVEIMNGAWAITQCPGRWRPDGNYTSCVSGFGACLYVSNSGNDTNDCLSSSTSCLTIGRAVLNVLQFIDPTGASPYVSIACGTYAESVNIQGPLLSTSVMWLVGGAPNVVSPGAHCVNWRNATAGNNYGLQLGDMMTLEVRNVYFDCTGCSGTNFGVAMHQHSILDLLSGIEFGQMGSGYHIYIDDHGKLNMPGGDTVNGTPIACAYTISGSATFHVFAGPGSYVAFNNPSCTITVSGSPTFTTLFNIFGPSMVAINSVTFSGAVSAGQRWSAIGGAFMQQVGTTWPTGSTAGTPVPGSAPYGGNAQ